MKILDTLSRSISTVTAVIATLCTLALAITISLDVVMRFASGRSLPGLVEASETLLVMMVFLGLAYCAYTGSHITMDLVTSALPPRTAALLRSIGDLAVIVLLLWMLFATGTRAVSSFATGEFKFGLVEWPLWPARGAIALGIAICIPVYLLALWKDVSELLGRTASTPSRPTDAPHVTV